MKLGMTGGHAQLQLKEVAICGHNANHDEAVQDIITRIYSSYKTLVNELTKHQNTSKHSNHRRNTTETC